MSVFGGFITGGTVSTDPDDRKKLVFTGIVINGALGAIGGDTFSAGGHQVFIDTIDGTGAATLVYEFPVALDNEAEYAIARDSTERYDPAATNLIARQYLAKVAGASIVYSVPVDQDGPTDLIAPDPQPNQKAIRFSDPWKIWQYIDGAWVEQPGSPGGPGPANTLSIGEVTEAADADATITGEAPNQILNLVMPVSTTPGPEGPIGHPFKPDEEVPDLAGRAAYDEEAKNFAVLVEADSSNDNLPTLYFKKSATNGDWSGGTTFTGGGLAGPESSTVGHVATFSDTTGKLIEDSGKSVADFATAAQGAKADTAVQPEDLGSAAFESASSFATSSQGSKADNALPASRVTISTSNASGGSDGDLWFKVS